MNFLFQKKIKIRAEVVLSPGGAYFVEQKTVHSNIIIIIKMSEKCFVRTKNYSNTEVNISSFHTCLGFFAVHFIFKHLSDP